MSKSSNGEVVSSTKRPPRTANLGGEVNTSVESEGAMGRGMRDREAKPDAVTRPAGLPGCPKLLTGGWMIAAISPGFASARDLPPELLLRTSPSLLDLGVAVAAGFAAGYVLTHRDASSVLPGVAVAVALVPPLAAIGVLANVGAGAEARGAFLLYLTNLGAIIVVAMALLFTSGFAPHDRRQGTQLPVRWVRRHPAHPGGRRSAVGPADTHARRRTQLQTGGAADH